MITHDDARKIAQRFIDGHFKNEGKEHPRISIPVDLKRDDDCRLLEYIDQCENLIGKQNQKQWLKPMIHCARKEDMSPDGWLSVFKEPDGDLIVTIYESERGMASAQFCTPISGGGKSPKVRAAIVALAEAIAEENKETPSFAPEIDGSAEAFEAQR